MVQTKSNLRDQAERLAVAFRDSEMKTLLEDVGLTNVYCAAIQGALAAGRSPTEAVEMAATVLEKTVVLDDIVSETVDELIAKDQAEVTAGEGEVTPPPDHDE